MKHWFAIFLLGTMVLIFSEPVRAVPLLQDTVGEGPYQLYPLGVACRDNNLETIKRLLSTNEESMAMGSTCYEFDVLYAAVYYNRETIFRYALSRYKDAVDRLYSDEYGLTLLTLACKLGNIVFSRILLENGADANGHQASSDLYPVYPLMIAIADKNVELVRLLLAYGASYDVQDADGNTPLSLARQVGSSEIEALLSVYISRQDGYLEGQKYSIRSHCDMLLGDMDGNNIIDTVYVRVISHCCYENDDGRRECFEQTDTSMLKICFGNSIEGFILMDEEIFDYPYSGLSSLSYSITKEGWIVRCCRSSRHSDKVYVDACYRYCSGQRNFFRVKELVRKYEGENVFDSVVKDDSIHVPLGIVIKREKL